MVSVTYQLTTEPYMRRTAVQRRISADHSRSTQTHAESSRGAVLTHIRSSARIAARYTGGTRRPDNNRWTTGMASLGSMVTENPSTEMLLQNDP